MGVQFHTFLTQALVEGGQFHAPANLPPGKELSIAIGSMGGWVPEPVWTMENSKVSCPCLEFYLNSLVVEPVA
jgi:hypothetical protein